MVSSDMREKTAFPYTAAVSGRYSAHPYGVEGTVSHVSNPVAVHVLRVTATKTVTPACAHRGEFVTYTIVICNESDLPIEQVKVLDPETARWFEIPDLYVEGKRLSEGDLQEGVSVGTLPPGQRATVAFDALARDWVPTAPMSAAQVQYEYEGEEGRCRGSILSNPAELMIVQPGISICKTADRGVATRGGGSVRYLLKVENTGNIPLTDVVVTDLLPPQMEYVKGSTRIDDGPPIQMDPEKGVFLDTLEAEQGVDIQYDARVKG
ncbi:MAG: DUF11 domain-containing protein [Oscillospiraceae bacterium]